MTIERSPQDGPVSEPSAHRSGLLKDDSYFVIAAQLYSEHIADDPDCVNMTTGEPEVWNTFMEEYVGSFADSDGFVEHTIAELGWYETLRLVSRYGNIPLNTIALDYDEIIAYLTRYYRVIPDEQHSVVEGSPVLHVYRKPGLKPPSATFLQRGAADA